MGYLWKLYFLQFPDYQLADYHVTGTGDIPYDRMFYLLLCRPWHLFSHILDWGPVFYLLPTWVLVGAVFLTIPELSVNGLSTNGARRYIIWSHVLSPSRVEIHYLDIFSHWVCVLPVVHMGYLWEKYFLQFPDCRLADYPLTGKDDIPSDHTYYLLLCWEGPVFRHIPTGGPVFCLWPTWGACGESISYDSRTIR